tara:strand:- start:1314 stop:2018 length:705 start_codon:yes stop_codon:yes gene_type:complete
MAAGKKSFLLYTDIINTVEQLPNDKAGELFKLILNYVNDRNPTAEDLLLKIAFEPIKQQLKRDLNKYTELVDRARENGKKGGRPKKTQTIEKPKEPTGLNNNLKKPVNDIVIDNVNDASGINKKNITKKVKLNDIKTREKEFIKNLKLYENEFTKEVLNEFYYYWSEGNQSDTKMRFELEKTWNLKLRLKRWKSNNYGNSTKNKEPKPTRINKFIKQDKNTKLGNPDGLGVTLY